MTTPKTQIDIAKREYDGNYVIWELRNLGIPHSDCSDPARNLVEYIIPWVPIKVFRKKRQATDYCRKQFGRNCFKENDNVTIAFV